MMTAYRSSTLNYLDRNCPRALDFHEAGATRDRSQFELGVAAHAVLQRLGEEAVRRKRPCNEAEAAAVAEVVTRKLITEGREFDGTHEPPMAPTAAMAGRDLALEWHAEHPASPTADYEIGIAMNEDADVLVDYNDPARRYHGIIDVLDAYTEGDEEQGYKVLEIADYKSAWPTDESELDSLQFKGYAALAVGSDEWLKTLCEEHEVEHEDSPDILRLTVHNLRLRMSWSRDIYLNDDEGAAWFARACADVLMACQAADDMLDGNDRREARPGVGCASCPYAYMCPEAWRAATDTANTPEGYVIAKGLADAAAPIVRELAKEMPVTVEGGSVGYHAKEQRALVPNAVDMLAAEWHGIAPGDMNEWRAENGAWLGLLNALSPGAGNVEKAARAIYGRGQKAERDDLLERLLTTVLTRRFGIEKNTETDE